LHKKEVSIRSLLHFFSRQPITINSHLKALLRKVQNTLHRNIKGLFICAFETLSLDTPPVIQVLHLK